MAFFTLILIDNGYLSVSGTPGMLMIFRSPGILPKWEGSFGSVPINFQELFREVKKEPKEKKEQGKLNSLYFSALRQLFTSCPSFPMASALQR
jgi:hypothetical protein